MRLNPIQVVLLALVRVYRWILSPAKNIVFGPAGRCRFTPSCSEYADEAIRRHGALRGSSMAVRRLCRCHPWGGCGPDPVPTVTALHVGSMPRPGGPGSFSDRIQHRKPAWLSGRTR
jgi:putative membrane protein insertion efficiency factor